MRGGTAPIGSVGGITTGSSTQTNLVSAGSASSLTMSASARGLT